MPRTHSAMMRLSVTQTRLIIIGIIVVVIALISSVFFLNRTPARPPAIKLIVWGAFDNAEIMNQVISKYRETRGNVNVIYKQVDPQTYESELINALSVDQGPDVFMFHNTWLPKHLNIVTPVKETQFPYIKFRGLFPCVVVQDFTQGTGNPCTDPTPQGLIYASPLYLDTLAMYYNKDIFDKNAIATVPKTWTEFQDVVKKIRVINSATNDIIKPGAAIGGSETSINRAADLLELIMLQSGTQMTDAQFTRALFTDSVDNRNPGIESLTYYTSFANAASPYYTWNENIHYSVDNFTEGNTGIFFNYSHQVPLIKAKNPFLNFGIAEVPQIADPSRPQPIAFPNYWGLAVSNKSKNPDWAWDFITGITTNEDPARIYFKASGHPPALKTLINEELNDPVYAVFAKQALIARSWPQIDSAAITNIFSEAIQNVLTNRLSAAEALKKAQDEVSLLMRAKQSN
jgi:multiple sugar transport system substrate-binding protein